MDFQQSEDQQAIAKWVHDFAEREIRPVAPEYDASEEFPWAVVKKAAEIGLYSIDFYSQTVVPDTSGLLLPTALEETAWGCAGIGLAIWGTGLPLSALSETGTPEQVAEWAPRLFGTPDEPAVGAFCVTEPQAGSDVSKIKTTAKRDGGDWVLNGRKVFITNGGIAAVHLVVASVDPALGSLGHATFIVPPGAPGLSQGRKERKLGIRASHTAEVVLDDCRVPADHVLGGVDTLEKRLAEGKTVSLRRQHSTAVDTFERTRPGVAAQALGVARAAFEFSLDYAKHRTAFGRPIVNHQAVAFKLADMALEVDAARLLTHRAAWMGRNATFRHGEGSMSKLKAGEVAVWVTEQAVQILGGYGYVQEFPVEKWYRDAKIFTIFEGTSEIQRVVIGRALATG